MLRSASLCLFALGIALSPVCSALADGVGVDVATAEQKLSAQKHFEVAIKSFQESKLDAALTEFTASYGVVASPNAHYMMAKCLDGLNRPADAYNALAPIEKESRGLDKYGETLKNSAELRSEVAKKVVVVTVAATAPSGANVTATVGHDSLPLGTPYAVMPGKVDIAVLLDGKVVKTDSKTRPAGDTARLTFDLSEGAGGPPKPETQGIPPAGSEPVASSSGGGRTGFFVGGGVSAAVAVAGFGVGIPFAIMYKNGKNDFETKCTKPGPTAKGACPSSVFATASTVQRNGNIATAGFVVGGVAAGLSVILFTVGATRSKGASSSDQSSIEVDVGPSSVGIAGAF